MPFAIIKLIMVAPASKVCFNQKFKASNELDTRKTTTQISHFYRIVFCFEIQAMNFAIL